MNTKLSKRFENYITEELGFTESSGITYVAEARYFLQWLKEKNRNYKSAKCIDVVDYIEYLNKRKLKHETILSRLIAIKHFYNFLDVRINPVHGIKIKGRERKVLRFMLNEEQLLNIYREVKNWKGKEEHSHRRNIVILGLMIFQGLRTPELSKMRLCDISLTNLKVRIPSGDRINGRTLEINPHQLLDIHQYIEISRKELLNRLNLNESEYLLLGGQTETGIGSILFELAQRLRKRIKDFENFGQLRNSVIVNWLKKGENLRLVQYKAGHKYISSTEKFKVGNIDELKRKVTEMFPL